jgi:glycosyltransferase involved in cell wall biosynthesis
LADISGDGQTFRKKHGIPCDAIVVLFLSRVDYKKGLDFLIPALSLLKREFPRLWFVLAGTGTPEFSEKVHGWLSENNILSFTKEVGFVSGQDKCNTLAAADIFALPSQNENFGIVNIEAMHAGLPLLISDQVYICKEIEEAGAGVVCHPNVHSVTEKLRNLLGGDIDLKQMGKRGQDLVRRLYRPEAATAALLELYAQILAG